MPSPKSAESLLEELDTWGARVRQMYGTAIVLDPKWLRSAFASYALYLEEKVTEGFDKDDIYEEGSSGDEAYGRFIAADILREEAEKLTNV